MDPLPRFRADLARVLPEGLPPGSPLALAVSGGPDSMAMLWLSARALPGRTVAATVDHGLRSESGTEAELVASACSALGVAHTTLRPTRAITGGNVHAAARAIRYALLGDWASSAGAAALATAHQLDDQAETFLMRAVRGSGTSGLAGVRARRLDGPLTIIRPLLGWRRVELAAVVEGAGLAAVTDPSNSDERFERTRVRRTLAERPWLDAVGLANAARHLGEAEAALESTAGWLWRARAEVGPDRLQVDVRDLPRELRRRLARKAIAARSPAFDVAANIEPLLDALDAGRAATHGDVLARPDGDIWRFTAAPPRRSGG